MGGGAPQWITVTTAPYTWLFVGFVRPQSFQLLIVFWPNHLHWDVGRTWKDPVWLLLSDRKMSVIDLFISYIRGVEDQEEEQQQQQQQQQHQQQQHQQQQQQQQQQEEGTRTRRMKKNDRKKHKNTGVKVLSLQIYEALCFVQFFWAKTWHQVLGKGMWRFLSIVFRCYFSICAPHDGGKVMIHLYRFFGRSVTKLMVLTVRRSGSISG